MFRNEALINEDTVDTRIFDRNGNCMYFHNREMFNSSWAWDEFGNEILYLEGASGGTTRRQADDKGRIIWQVSYMQERNGNRALFDSTVYSYSSDGNTVTQITYDEYGRAGRSSTRQILPQAPAAANQFTLPTSAVIKRDRQNRIIQVDNPENREEWHYGYNAQGQMTERTVLMDTRGPFQSFYVHDPATQQPVQLANCRTNTTPIRENKWQYKYDNRGRLIQTKYTVDGQLAFEFSARYAQDTIPIERTERNYCQPNMSQMYGQRVNYYTEQIMYNPATRVETTRFLDNDQNLLLAVMVTKDADGKIINVVAKKNDNRVVYEHTVQYNDQSLPLMRIETYPEDAERIEYRYEYTYWE